MNFHEQNELWWMDVTQIDFPWPIHPNDKAIHKPTTTQI
jgi:hypothetical protein